MLMRLMSFWQRLSGRVGAESGPPCWDRDAATHDNQWPPEVLLYFAHWWSVLLMWRLLKRATELGLVAQCQIHRTTNSPCNISWRTLCVILFVCTVHVQWCRVQTAWAKSSTHFMSKIYCIFDDVIDLLFFVAILGAGSRRHQLPLFLKILPPKSLACDSAQSREELRTTHGKGPFDRRILVSIYMGYNLH